MIQIGIQKKADNTLISTYLVYILKVMLHRRPRNNHKVIMMSHVKAAYEDIKFKTYELSDDNKFKIPLRVYGLFHYDLDIKFVASMQKN